MTTIEHRYHEICRLVSEREVLTKREKNSVQLVVVSKTHPVDRVKQVLEIGHRHFGENRVQEAQSKWPELKLQYPDIELHLIGPLQSNKAADAVELFDVIETIDREKIAAAIAKEASKQSKNLTVYVQVNTGMEAQKAGIEPERAVEFVGWCRQDKGLNVEGLMCIPPLEHPPGPHFALLNRLAQQADCRTLSMGMSADFEIAIQMGATHVRVGSGIFGNRS